MFVYYRHHFFLGSTLLRACYARRHISIYIHTDREKERERERQREVLTKQLPQTSASQYCGVRVLQNGALGGNRIPMTTNLRQVSDDLSLIHI